jgi:hypothetical protein
VASHTRTPIGAGIILGAPEPAEHGQEGKSVVIDLIVDSHEIAITRSRSAPRPAQEHWSSLAAKILSLPRRRRRLQPAERRRPHERHEEMTLVHNGVVHGAEFG